MTFEGLPVESKEEAVQELKKLGFEGKEAEEVAELLEEEAKEDLENAKTLWNNLKNKADAFIAELGLETFSWVGNPSQPSKFVMMKSDDGQFNSTSPILKDTEKDEEWETIYAPVMQPSAVDKDGEVIPSKIIRDSAHEFLAEGKTDQIDADHNLITGKGELVESWILKEDKTYELPDYYEEDEFKVEKGSWMVGVKPTEEARKKIESGEYRGFSIFGEAEKIELSTSFKMKQVEKDDIEGDNMGENDNEGEDIGLKEVAEGVETLKEELSDLSESVSEIKEEDSIEAKEVSTVEELKEAIGEGPVVLELEAEDLEFEKEEEKEEGEAEKGVEETVERLAEQLDMSKEEVMNALQLEDDEDEDEDEDEKEAKGKGTLGEGTRKSTLENDEKSGSLSFQDRAEQKVEG